MHRVFYIQEVLLHIFSYCDTPLFPWSPRLREQRHYANAHLAALARTCKTFKEPALDLLWDQLSDLTPLVRFLDHSEVNAESEYSLTEHPTQTEWDIILGYARRVRSLSRLHGSLGLTVDSIEILSNPPTSTTDLLFPNLLIVGLHEPSPAIIPHIVRHLAIPGLIDLLFEMPDNLGPHIDTFTENCPNLTDIRISRSTDSDAISSLICRWKNLRMVACPRVYFNADAFGHLSSLYDLHCLSFKIHDPTVDQIYAYGSSTSPFNFLALRDMIIFSVSLPSVSRFLRRSYSPVIDYLSIDLDIPPTTSELVSFFSAVQEACSQRSLTQLVMNVLFPEENQPVYITFDHLRPLTCFVNIRSIWLDSPCGADLNETELLALASSWPQLAAFNVGSGRGWTTSSAVTPGGFLKLLERCRSLQKISFRMDTREFTEIPQGHPWRGLSMADRASINLLNSPIEERCVQALGVFFHAAPFPYCRWASIWDDPDFTRTQQYPGELCQLYYDRWKRVFSLARDLQKERWALRKSLENRSL